MRNARPDGRYLREVSTLLQHMRLAGSDWGFDKMWCGAATTYNAEGRDEQAAPAPPCAIVPLAV